MQNGTEQNGMSFRGLKESEQTMRDKQIEEIYKDLDEIYSTDFIGDYAGGLKDIASQLVDKGYRKASEIFEEIEKKVKASITVHLEELNKEHIQDTPLYDRHSGIIFALRGIDDFITELKKKYLGEDINAPTKESEGEG